MEKASLIMFSVKKWIKAHKAEVIIFLLVFAIGAFLRLYNIDEYMTFLGDEGRDARIVSAFLKEGDIMLIGPGTSIGNMYLGPMYYYFIAPGLLLFNFSPVGPSIQIALFSLVTIFMIWFIAREWFPSKSKINWGALTAAFLYAISPTVIIYSRSSWNPNIMPFAALLAVYSIWRVWQHKQYWWLFVLGFSFAFVLQSHYLGLLLLPTLGIFWLASLLGILKDRKLLKRFTIFSLGGGALFVTLMSPLVIFDIRHGLQNFNSMKLFFTERQTTVSAKPWNALPEAWPLSKEIASRLLGGRNPDVGQWVALGLAAVALWVSTQKGKKRLPKVSVRAFLLLFTWLGFALIGLGVYRQNIYDHYYGFFFPAPFLILGGVATYLIGNYKIRGWWIVGTAMVFLVYFNLADNPLKYSPNRQLQRTVEVAEFIRDDSAGKQFNLAVIAERNYEAAYQYYLENWNTGITMIDPQNTDDTIADYLYVVCEFADKNECDPTHDAKSEVANFGWSKIDQEWDVAGTTVYRLVHSVPKDTSLE